MSSGNVELDSISANIPVLKNAVGGILMCDICHRKLLGVLALRGCSVDNSTANTLEILGEIFYGPDMCRLLAANSRRRVNWSWPLRELGASSGGPFAANLAFEMFVLMM